jgi:hypothetical protein
MPAARLSAAPRWGRRLTSTRKRSQSHGGCPSRSARADTIIALLPADPGHQRDANDLNLGAALPRHLNLSVLLSLAGEIPYTWRATEESTNGTAKRS